ncbi:CaiB/BaiF CoA transferase family protein [Inhella sp.]|uniref:CaiB/BaiF CoA transferase family protein n=1 Tax=Inhella sp. TaxID=1921806 RepID=UPI0035B0667F
MRALQGITVLDLTHMLSGPYGAMVLADLGARCIKVEPPGAGEGTRALLAKDRDFSRDGMGAYFLTLNRGKESICVDLKSEAGREVFYDLVRHADVVIDNFSVGVTQRLGIDHESLAKVNERIVTCSISGFGATGPDPHRPAFDQVVQAMGGGMSITGFADSPPVRSGIPHGDLGGGVFGAIGVLAALVNRQLTGKGRHVDVSMLDVQASLLNYMATMYLMSGQVPDRIGNSHFVHVPYNSFRTADGYVIVACIGDAFFEKFVEMLGRDELRDPELRKQPVRFAAKAQIEAVIHEEFAKQGNEYWLARLREARIPCGPVNDFAAALSDPQLLARNMVIEVELPGGSKVRMPGNPVKLEGCDDPAQPSPPPRLGEHTDAVLGTLPGYDKARLASLRERGVIA